jgi:hypothetical protein
VWKEHAAQGQSESAYSISASGADDPEVDSLSDNIKFDGIYSVHAVCLAHCSELRC